MKTPKYILNDWIVGKLKKIANTGQSIEPDHWKYRCMARETAAEILEKIERESDSSSLPVAPETKP